MNRCRIKGLFAIIGFLMTILISGCSINLKGSEVTLTITQPWLPHYTTTPIPTRINSSPFPSPTHTPTLESQWTPSAKLPLDEVMLFMEKITTDNGGCEFPCFWGVVPGLTTGNEIHQIFSPLGEVLEFPTHSETIVYELCVPYCTSNKPFYRYSPRFWVKRGVVIGITTNISWAYKDFNYSLADMLIIFGDPDEIWIRAIRESSDDQPYYDLRLFYQTKGMMISLNGNAQNKADLLQVCPQLLFTRTPPPIPILLFDNHEKILFQEIETKILQSSIHLNTEEFQLIDQAAPDFTSKDFLETYRQPNSLICFDVRPLR